MIARIWAAGKRTYLPVLHGRRLWFLPYDSETPLARNRFGILEPDVSPKRRRALEALDMVLVPLVAFDEQGNRLGMGGGYYDRTFAYLLGRRRWTRPLLVGVAYEFQCSAALPTRPWDVPLQAVATERGLRFFARRQGR